MESKNTKTCAYCGKEFENTRSNRIYCSDSCIKKASYHRNKKKKLDQKQGPVINNDEQENKIVFKVSEYEEYKEFLKKLMKRPKFSGCDEELEFFEYCFFRKNIPGEVNFELFIKQYYSDLIFDIRENKNIPLYKEYCEFLSDLNKGKYSIDTSNESSRGNTHVKHSISNNFPTNFV